MDRFVALILGFAIFQAQKGNIHAQVSVETSTAYDSDVSYSSTGSSNGAAALFSSFGSSSNINSGSPGASIVYSVGGSKSDSSNPVKYLLEGTDGNDAGSTQTRSLDGGPPVQTGSSNPIILSSPNGVKYSYTSPIYTYKIGGTFGNTFSESGGNVNEGQISGSGPGVVSFGEPVIRTYTYNTGSGGDVNTDGLGGMNLTSLLGQNLSGGAKIITYKSEPIVHTYTSPVITYKMSYPSGQGFTYNIDGTSGGNAPGFNGEGQFSLPTGGFTYNIGYPGSSEGNPNGQVPSGGITYGEPIIRTSGSSPTSYTGSGSYPVDFIDSPYTNGGNPNDFDGRDVGGPPYNNPAGGMSYPPGTSGNQPSTGNSPSNVPAGGTNNETPRNSNQPPPGSSTGNVPQGGTNNQNPPGSSPSNSPSGGTNETPRNSNQPPPGGSTGTVPQGGPSHQNPPNNSPSGGTNNETPRNSNQPPSGGSPGNASPGGTNNQHPPSNHSPGGATNNSPTGGTNNETPRSSNQPPNGGSPGNTPNGGTNSQTPRNSNQSPTGSSNAGSPGGAFAFTSTDEDDDIMCWEDDDTDDFEGEWGGQGPSLLTLNGNNNDGFEEFDENFDISSSEESGGKLPWTISQGQAPIISIAIANNYGNGPSEAIANGGLKWQDATTPSTVNNENGQSDLDAFVQEILKGQGYPSSSGNGQWNLQTYPEQSTNPKPNYGDLQWFLSSLGNGQRYPNAPGYNRPNGQLTIQEFPNYPGNNQPNEQWPSSPNGNGQLTIQGYPNSPGNNLPNGQWPSSPNGNGQLTIQEYPNSPGNNQPNGQWPSSPNGNGQLTIQEYPNSPGNNQPNGQWPSSPNGNGQLTIQEYPNSPGYNQPNGQWPSSPNGNGQLTIQEYPNSPGYNQPNGQSPSSPNGNGQLTIQEYPNSPGYNQPNAQWPSSPNGNGQLTIQEYPNSPGYNQPNGQWPSSPNGNGQLTIQEYPNSPSKNQPSDVNIGWTPGGGINEEEDDGELDDMDEQIVITEKQWPGVEGPEEDFYDENNYGEVDYMVPVTKGTVNGDGNGGIQINPNGGQTSNNPNVHVSINEDSPGTDDESIIIEGIINIALKGQHGQHGPQTVMPKSIDEEFGEYGNDNVVTPGKVTYETDFGSEDDDCDDDEDIPNTQNISDEDEDCEDEDDDVDDTPKNEGDRAAGSPGNAVTPKRETTTASEIDDFELEIATGTEDYDVVGTTRPNSGKSPTSGSQVWSPQGGNSFTYPTQNQINNQPQYFNMENKVPITSFQTYPGQTTNNQPQYQNSPQTTQNQPQYQNSPQTTRDQPQYQNSPQTTQNQPQYQNSPQTTRDQPQYQNSPQTTQNQPQYQNSPQTTHNQPQYQNSPQTTHNQPQYEISPQTIQYQNSPQTTYNLPQYQNSPQTTQNQPQYQNSPIFSIYGENNGQYPGPNNQVPYNSASYPGEFQYSSSDEIMTTTTTKPKHSSAPGSPEPKRSLGQAPSNPDSEAYTTSTTTTHRTPNSFFYNLEPSYQNDLIPYRSSLNIPPPKNVKEPEETPIPAKRARPQYNMDYKNDNLHYSLRDIRSTQQQLLQKIQGAYTSQDQAVTQAADEADTWYYPSLDLRQSFMDSFGTVTELINQARAFLLSAEKLLSAMESTRGYLHDAWLKRVILLQNQAQVALARAQEAQNLILTQMGQVTYEMNLYRKGREEQYRITKDQIDAAVRAVSKETAAMGLKIRDIFSQGVDDWTNLLRKELGTEAQPAIDELNEKAADIMNRLNSLQPSNLDETLVVSQRRMDEIRGILYNAGLSASQISKHLNTVQRNMYSIISGSNSFNTNNDYNHNPNMNTDSDTQTRGANPQGGNGGTSNNYHVHNTYPSASNSYSYNSPTFSYNLPTGPGESGANPQNSGSGSSSYSYNSPVYTYNLPTGYGDTGGRGSYSFSYGNGQSNPQNGGSFAYANGNPTGQGNSFSNSFSYNLPGTTYYSSPMIYSFSSPMGARSIDADENSQSNGQLQSLQR